MRAFVITRRLMSRRPGELAQAWCTAREVCCRERHFDRALSIVCASGAIANPGSPLVNSVIPNAPCRAEDSGFEVVDAPR